MTECSIDGCERDYHARGYCKPHYKRLMRWGNPLGGRPSPDPSRTCSVPGCDSRYHAGGYCRRHYRRHLKGRDLTAPFRGTQSPEERFWPYVDKSADGECWEFLGQLDIGGYGVFKHGPRNAPRVKAHRFAYEALIGPIPEGMFLDHLCFNRKCVNPDHLRVVTAMQNVQHRQGPQSRNQTGVRNVTRQGDKYLVQVGANYKLHRIGSFDSLEEAESAAIQARKQLHGLAAS